MKIDVGDILVSVVNNEVILRSKRLNRRIIPRLTTAHNYVDYALPIYRFLGELQTQGIAQPCVWDWGPISDQKFLPRVFYKNIILSRARWVVYLNDLVDAPVDEQDYIGYFNGFRAKLGIPRYVVYSESDNKLLLDFCHIVGIKLFLQYLRRNHMVTLEEYLFNHSNCIVQDIEGRPFTNEVIIPLFRKEPSATYLKKSVDQQITEKRKFTPNSEWLFFKIYCGTKTAEKILTGEIASYLEYGIEHGFFEKFFFMRYFDDTPHLRIRFFNCTPSSQIRVYDTFTRLLGQLLDRQLIEKFTIDTYYREIERYGNTVIEETETLFFLDSIAVIRFLRLLDDQESEKYRVIFALRSIDYLLDDFAFGLSEKHWIVDQIRAAFFGEFGGTTALQKQLNSKYRELKGQIESHMTPDLDVENEIEDAVAIFLARSEANKPVISRIREKLDNNRNQINDILISYIHMLMNRHFMTNQRKYELLVYHFLERHYKSKIALETRSANIVH